MMARRIVTLTLTMTFAVAALLPLAAGAQQAAKIARIGYLHPNLATGVHQHEAFRQALRELGWAEGRNLIINYRDGEGKPERLPVLAAELVALKVDAIVAVEALAAQAAARATRTIPIVSGGSSRVLDLPGKCLEQLRLALPGAGWVVVLWQPGTLGEESRVMEDAELAGRARGMRLQFVEARSPAEFDRAFAQMTKAQADALVVLPSPMFTRERRRLVELAARNRLPAMYMSRDFVDAGGLMSCGGKAPDAYRLAATSVARLLGGAKPADAPVGASTKPEVVINVKTARALGLTIPPSALAQADRVVE